jgi:hypothetical protein
MKSVSYLYVIFLLLMSFGCRNSEPEPGEGFILTPDPSPRPLNSIHISVYGACGQHLSLLEVR